MWEKGIHIYGTPRVHNFSLETPFFFGLWDEELLFGNVSYVHPLVEREREREFNDFLFIFSKRI